MFNFLGAAFIVLLLAGFAATVIIKYLQGTRILVMGQGDKRELLFGLGYFLLLYIILSNAAPLPMPGFVNRFFWENEVARAVGAALCALGLAGSVICTVNFWKSVRIGVDYKNAGELTTTGIYALSRNPMYTSFFLLFVGEFLIFPNIGLLVSLILSAAAFHTQVRKEEKFLAGHYGEAYAAYCRKVRRYL